MYREPSHQPWRESPSETAVAAAEAAATGESEGSTDGVHLRVRLTSPPPSSAKHLERSPTTSTRPAWQLVADYGPFVRPVRFPADDLAATLSMWDQAVAQSVDEAVRSSAFLRPSIPLGSTPPNADFSILGGPYVASLVLRPERLMQLVGGRREAEPVMWVFSNSLLMIGPRGQDSNDSIQSVVLSMTKFSATESPSFTPLVIELDNS